MKKIKLTRGQFALVDDEDYEELNQFKWYALKKRYTFYARRSIYIDSKTITSCYMHRQILGLVDRNIQCDHKDTNGLNNQKSNLRECSNTENQKNQRPRVGYSSKYKGVSFVKKRNKWVSGLVVDKKHIFLGSFINEIEAAKAYDEASILHHGEFAYTNF